MAINPYIVNPGAYFVGCIQCGSNPCVCLTLTTGMVPPGSGNIVKYQKYPNVKLTPSDTIDMESEIRKQLKLHIHFAKEWVTRHLEWHLVPDSSRPFDRVYLVHDKKRLKLIDNFPMNELEIVGLSMREYNTLYPSERELMPNHQHLIRYRDFELWAIGAEPLPDLLL